MSHAIFVAGETIITALHECDVDIFAGCITVIVGKSGSGKSTLCNVLSGVDHPTSGTVTLLGHDFSSLSDSVAARLRAQSIGFVLQRDNLVPWLTIEENVAAPLIFGGKRRKAGLAEARDYLDLVGLGHRAKSWPSVVSGGEAQRAAVARACISRPAVVFADEPTGSLDRQNAEQVYELFRKLVSTQKTAGVLVTHDIDLADDADIVLRMQDGRLTKEWP